jgi:hypothetical protein
MSYQHTETVPCDYQLVEKCEKTLPAGRGLPHHVFIGSSQVETVKWCCLPCDMEFDND